MKEIVGELWDYYKRPNTIVCITTNGTLRKDGCGVMGRGCAFEATKRVPDIIRLLGEAIRRYQTVVVRFSDLGRNEPIFFFPVKHNWWEKADLGLIKRSAQWLSVEASLTPDIQYILPRPGCGNGKRTWDEVKPLLKDLPDNVLVITKERP